MKLMTSRGDVRGFAFDVTRRSSRDSGHQRRREKSPRKISFAGRRNEIVKRDGTTEILTQLLSRDDNLVGLCRTRYEGNFHAGVRGVIKRRM